MMFIIDTLLEASAAFLHTPIIFGASFILYFAYKGFNSPSEYASLITYHEKRYNDLAASMSKYRESRDRIQKDDYAMVKKITDAFKASEALAKQLRSQALLRVEDKGQYPTWSVMSFEDCLAAIQVSKADLNAVLQGGRYEDEDWIITMLDANDVNARQLDYDHMLEETEGSLNKAKRELAYLKDQTFLDDVREDWEHWEMRFRDALSTALADSDFIERAMDDLHSELLEHLTNE